MSLKVILCTAVFSLIYLSKFAHSHEAKDFDDSILYKIEFEAPNFDENPNLKELVHTFHTHDKEEYSCVIPRIDETKQEKKADDIEISPLKLLQPIFSSVSCSYRIEAYWSYEICHGFHIKQYHEEREGKNLKFQEYFLGKWSDEKTSLLSKSFEEDRKAGIKYKTTKIDNLKYPYFEMDMTDGTLCDIIGEPRTTKIRYVCYPHGKNEIYSFKETSSCNYEAVILTSLLCMDPSFHPEDSKEISLKCFNSPTESRKPLSLLRQELKDLQMADLEIGDGGISANGKRVMFVNKIGMDIDKLVLEGLLADSKGSSQISGELESPTSNQPTSSNLLKPLLDLSPITNFLNGRSNCLTGGTGWWKYEFCYGRHVRQVHKDRHSESELMLGFFNEDAHREWIKLNPEKAPKTTGGGSVYIWHHYEGGTRCDRTRKPREVDVKLTCTPAASSPTSVSMYLLEPRTCQYILVVESPIICDVLKIVDEDGLVQQYKLDLLLKEQPVKDVSVNDDSPINGSSEEEGNRDESVPEENKHEGNDALKSKVESLQKESEQEKMHGEL